MFVSQNPIPRNNGLLRGDWDFGCSYRCHRKYASPRNHQNNHRIAWHVIPNALRSHSHPKFWNEEGKSSLLLFSALGAPAFRSVKLRSRKLTCPACGKEGQKMGEIRSIDYVTFCGGSRPDWEARGLVDSGDATRIRAEVS